ncbi:MAG: nuclear transport factor 2 family protein [Microthrixaceae bacterium]
MTISEPDLRSPLDQLHPDYDERPFFEQTLTLLRSVRDHDFDTLAELCDDDFGIVDVDPSGASVAVRTRADWEHWFDQLFAQLDALHAATDSEILDYVAVEGPTFGYSVLDFRQTLTMEGLTAAFDCLATIIWKSTPDGWREARWHASVLSTDIPTGFGA